VATKLLQARSTGAGSTSNIGYVLLNLPTAKNNPSTIALNVNSVQQSPVGPVVLPGSGWHELEMYTAISGSTGSFTIWLDGSQVLTFSGLALGSGSLPIAQMQLGDTGETADVLFDDAAFDTQFLP
jgi:hypothetical protein